MNIVVEETHVFSTKQRAPYYICIEAYNPIESFSEAKKDRYYEQIEKPITLKVKFLLFSTIFSRKQWWKENILMTYPSEAGNKVKYDQRKILLKAIIQCKLKSSMKKTAITWQQNYYNILTKWALNLDFQWKRQSRLKWDK